MSESSVAPAVTLEGMAIIIFGVTGDLTRRKLMPALYELHRAGRGCTGLGFDQEIPHHSTFSKNRHGRFQHPGRVVDQGAGW